MVLPIFQSYPVGWQNPVVARVSAVLPAAGAWDATPTEFSVAGAKFMSIKISYTRGAAGGAVDWQIEGSIYAVAANVPAGTGEWGNETALAVGAVATGADTQNLVQSEYETFGSQGAAIETIVIGPIELRQTIERLRIPCRESGVVGTPGIAAVVVELW